MLIVASLFAASHPPSVASAEESPRATSQDCESIGNVGFTAIDLNGQPDARNGNDVAEETEDSTETVHNVVECWITIIGSEDLVREYCIRWEIRENPGGAGSSRVCVETEIEIVTVPVYGQKCRYIGHSHDGSVTASVAPSGPAQEHGSTGKISTLPSVGSDVALVSESLEL